MRQHSMVGLIDRTEAQALVRRQPSATDRRKVLIYVTLGGDLLLHRLHTQHQQELSTMDKVLRLPL
jgi:DNA-binding MarR family transcriptional regulator